jgi:hypothetical protein
MMVGSKRISVVLSLAGYLLATTAIHALHDHSGWEHSAAGHCCQDEPSCPLGAFDTNLGDGARSADACAESAHHGRHSSPTNGEDSCFACRFLAAKTIVPAVVLPVERFETVCQLEALSRVLAPVAQIECSLCRGPPRAC